MSHFLRFRIPALSHFGFVVLRVFFHFIEIHKIFWYTFCFVPQAVHITRHILNITGVQHARGKDFCSTFVGFCEPV